MLDISLLKSLVNEPWSERSFAARAQISDSLRTYPRTDDLENLQVPEVVGPWRIKSDGDNFEWHLTEAPSINDLGAWELSRTKISGDKGDRVRVVLVGESAAGSFGYWEEATLAKQLEHRLQAANDRIEVIDLSCVNASMELCLEVMKCAVTLDPDYYVLYCGNNEGKTLLESFDSGLLNAATPTAARWEFLAGSLSTYGYSMVNALASHCGNQLSRAAQIARHFEVELLYILPESNSVDWAPQEHTSFSRPGKTAVLCTTTLAEQATSCDASQAELWKMGKSQVHQQPAQGQALMDAAREAGIGAFINAVPQTVSTVAEALRATCRREAIEFVDMPALFRSIGTGAPDRSRFIDYCHLSLAGIEDVSDATARHLLLLEGIQGIRSPAESFRASARESFLGALVGAIHNYHYGQGREVVSHWVDAALSSGWTGAGEFLDLLRTVLIERPRETYTMQRLERHEVFAQLSDRYKLFFLKFVYHGRFDLALIEVLDQVQGRQTVSDLLAVRSDDLLAFRGDMYSLFYLDCQKGIRPRLRGSNRTGWERPDMEFLIERPHFEIDIPPTRWEYSALELELETDDSCVGATISLTMDEDGAVVLPLRAGRAQYIFHLSPGQHRLRRAKFHVDHFVGLADKPTPVERYKHLGRFGWYPCAGRLLALKLIPGAANNGEGTGE